MLKVVALITTNCGSNAAAAASRACICMSAGLVECRSLGWGGQHPPTCLSNVWPSVLHHGVLHVAHFELHAKLCCRSCQSLVQPSDAVCETVALQRLKLPVLIEVWVDARSVSGLASGAYTSICDTF